MPATKFKVWGVGRPVGEGVTTSFHVGIAAIAKGNSDKLPYVVANELLCGYLAKALLLPIPPAFLIDHEGNPHYVSLNFNLAGEDLPPVDARAIVTEHSELAGGIVLFDAWIANSDRHRKNIAHHDATGRVQIFDHSHAFLSKKGPQRFEQVKGGLSIGNHCLAAELESLDGIVNWQSRIEAVPEFFIRGVADSLSDVGVATAGTAMCADFLLSRRERLLTLVNENRGAFPKIDDGDDEWDKLPKRKR